MADKYYRILLKKVEDARLLSWLERERLAGESPNKAIRKKLYSLMGKNK